MTAPKILRGPVEIAAHLGLSVGTVEHRHRQRTLPTFQVRGVYCATAAALNDWLALYRAGHLPNQ